VTKFHLIWLLASVGISYFINEQSKPVVDFSLDAGELAMPRGTASLDGPPGEVEVDLIDIHVVARDVPQFLGPTLHARELWIRSPQQDEGAEPDLEVFVDLQDPEAATLGVKDRDPEHFVDRELPILVRPLGRPGVSRVRFPGADHAAEVVEGTFVIDQALELDTDDAPGAWRIRGRLDMLVRDGDLEQPVSGSVRSRLLWR
jgi:hypothetical protein